MPFLAQWFVKCINLRLGNGWKEAEEGSCKKKQKKKNKARRGKDKINKEKKGHVRSVFFEAFITNNHWSKRSCEHLATTTAIFYALLCH